MKAPTPRRFAALSLAIAIVILPVAGFAQAPDERPPPGRDRILSVPRAASPPKIDGVPDDEAWKYAAVADRFWIVEQEHWPAEQTEVLVTSDAKFLYFAFRAHDSQPDRIVALDTRRDASLKGDDQVCIELDPFLSHREVSSYCINARGTVSDSIAGGRASQEAWKGSWEGAARRTPDGWTAEMAIPFDILNFEDGATTFGVNFLRYQNRTAEWSRWADTTVQDLPEERGRLTGLTPGRVSQRYPLTAMPYLLGGKNIPDMQGDIQRWLVNGGIDIRYQPKTNLTGVLSINPDFSQVEEAVTDITFSYNEKFKVDNRPFFQEGSAYFGKTELFYTNSVPNFYGGVKLFGRQSGVMYGALATLSPDERIDGVLQLQWEIDARHSIGIQFVGTDQQDFRNGVLYGNVQARERFGLLYQVEGAVSRTELQPGGDGWFLQPMVGWKGNYWTLKATGYRYTSDYHPALGLLADDLLGTRGVDPSFSIYRETAKGFLRVLNAYAAWNWRETEDGLLQQRNISAGGSVELRYQVRLGIYYSGGLYRPLLDGIPNNWSEEFNHDRTLGGTIDLLTRSSFLQFGGSYTGGNLGGGEYKYMSGYLASRPTATTSIKVTAERAYSFGYSDQVVVNAGWDITPQHNLYARYIYNDGDDYYRAAYTWHVTRNVDLFVVYDKQPGEDASVSAKLVIGLPIPFPSAGAAEPRPTGPRPPEPVPPPKPQTRFSPRDAWIAGKGDVSPALH